MMSKSHNPEEIDKAWERGEEIWKLDTGSDGEDDILIGSREEVETDICFHFEIDQLPSHWSLRRIESLEE